ncbi:hypothetical protein [Sphingobacterium sp. E70]|uniref:hypothetical protein n=1 Tax=Sphingobacterium sp. E70 TaxID=2853439 RepID=UPI0027955C82|nr:hypothetical protein [Sphingobacterium sp. E70]
MLTNHNLYKVIKNYMDYFRIRTSNKITFELLGDTHVEAKLNIPLFDWIIENLLKNG